MGLNYVTGDREQRFLLAPDMRDWLAPEHLCWFVIDVVEALDLDAFHRSYRADGHGRAAYDPAVMVAVLLYAYCTGVRSSRQIQRRCLEQIDYRILAAGLAPDHVTLARFRARHADALAAVFVDSLRLCAEAGLVSLGAIAVDGTKIAANASIDRNRTSEELGKQISAILAEAAEIDAAEDAASDQDHQSESGPAVDPALRRAALDAARQRLEAARTRLEVVAADRAARFEARSAQLNAARAAKGQPPRQFRPRARDEAPKPGTTTNLTDPDSRPMQSRHGRVQGFNAQTVTTAGQIIVAAEVSTDSNDVAQLAPMLSATRAGLTAAGITEPIDALVADAGYWRAENVNASHPDLARPDGPTLYIAVARHGRRGKPRQDGKPSEATTTALVEQMTARLKTDTGKKMMRMRSTSVEPVFGQIKHGRGIRQLSRRGLVAARAEWKLIAATHNLLKLYRATAI
ncbi:transposase [Pseudonocardia endophytica]|uniref:Transposase n=1 Tax=Pseudonocardia endophytica TaxID=401976 RepID=A0A4R1HKD9_PSEEN|nr:transposase [Pseudonocardia endophytica]TCK21393.1 transposase [Pseudonocardia endophytica]TCK26610.1 transposase [Pseudonocardia endophytica]